ncbi:hypothetical protein DFQ01_12199 [Paenibacillus cellulosilyticus]|uniref:Uncharacterized protein n=1 Tax=Paenibacillus cellulosilyticus TaxID=375489 RepID=A0A2V2YP45_9BACL|nr:hypothetical protein [Paenibacillus cellulosilyticus]PWV97455.1 hypothetical protein DFQ01_12199 [Paenibacillus cellulosilyticus]QKS48508.1 hypothetical protein HUB94_30195 [Paenibacillus cellulosilyticus]
MDYNAFFKDVIDWIGQVNKMAMQHGMGNPSFWAWVTESTSALSQKYQDHRIAVKQMVMLIEWLEEVYEKGR